MTTAADLAAGDPDAAHADAIDLLLALRGVVRQLRSPLPTDAPMLQRWRTSPPAPRHLIALMHVVGDEGMSVGQLAEALGVSLATASQVVTELEADRLLERYTDPTDRRRTLLRISDEHRSVVDALVGTRLHPVQRALDRMKPSERRALLRGLELVAEELGKVTE